MKDLLEKNETLRERTEPADLEAVTGGIGRDKEFPTDHGSDPYEFNLY